MIVIKEFRFEASHLLEGYEGNCAKLHGHSYRLEVAVKGNPEGTGMVIDFKKMSEIVKEKAVNKLDHSHLNELISCPTAENISIWVWGRLKNHLNLSHIRLWETENSSVIYDGKSD